MALIFRNAEAADLDAMVAMLADDELGRGRERWESPIHPAYRDAFDAIQADPNNVLIVADDSGLVVGMLQLTFIPGLSRLGGWRAQIEAVRVAAARRGSGIGQQMIQWAIEHARSRQCQLVQLTTDKQRGEAHRFYERLGFQASHEGMKLTLS